MTCPCQTRPRKRWCPGEVSPMKITDKYDEKAKHLWEEIICGDNFKFPEKKEFYGLLAQFGRESAAEAFEEAAGLLIKEGQAWEVVWKMKADSLRASRKEKTK